MKDRSPAFYPVWLGVAYALGSNRQEFAALEETGPEDPGEGKGKVTMRHGLHHGQKSSAALTSFSSRWTASSSFYPFVTYLA